MPVEGLLGFRVNRWHKEDNGLLVRSPSWRDFEWDKGIVWAKCEPPKYTRPRVAPTCDLDEEGHFIPGEFCRCGMYATISRKILAGYATDARSVVFLVEAMGEGWAYTEGWRSSGALAIAIVNTAFLTWKINEMTELEDGSKQRDISNYHLSMFAASEFFKIPIIEWNVALEMIRIQWMKEGGLVWPYTGKFDHMFKEGI